MAFNEGSNGKVGRIPKRKFEDSDTSNSSLTGGSILSDSYYNNTTQSHWPSYNPNSSITQSICNAVAARKERPKNVQKNIFRETVPDVDDATLPKELTSMFQPLFCKLCSAQLSSNVMAKLHYKSKNHEKKIRKFLIEYSQRTGEPLHKRAKVGPAAKTEEEQNPRWFHCEICDLPLTGKMHAESHYMGKNHQKVMMGHKLPAGKGYYNDEGKWVRQTSSKPAPLPDGQDTFGLSFRKQTPEETVTTASTSVAPAKQDNYRCDVCNVSATCQEQIDMHFNGQKHQKKLKQLGLGLPAVTTGEKLLSSKAAVTKEMDINLTVYRTPSGDFYCPTCNLTLNSEEQFKTHLKSRGHMKKYAQKHKTNSVDSVKV